MINWPSNRLPKRNAFVTVSTDYGTMLVNRFDRHIVADGIIGVGNTLLETSSFDAPEINLIMAILVNLKEIRQKHIIMLDAGANVGVHALSAGRLMQGWGEVISFEAQERVFYALAGNIAMNNLFNVTARWAALGEECGVLDIPVVDYFTPSSFGSLELKQTQNSEYIGQRLTGQKQSVVMLNIDSLNLPGLDFFKIDVEAMEAEVIRGAAKTIKKYHPVIHMEQLKSNRDELKKVLDKFKYVTIDNGPNMIAFHKDDVIGTIFKQGE